ncbi:MAG: hypothetical protein K2X81_18275, partial [Candidatus Obscuribacterales bacterium]|nr:hypothetical protein [Candidatus Obscuribacterales bacterium]
MKRYIVALALSACSLIGTQVFAAHDSKTCASECKNCAEVCEKTLAYCTKKGGAHAKADVLNALKDC